MEIQPFHKPKGIHNAIIQKGWSKWGNWGWATLIHWKIMEINQNILNLWFNIFFSAILSTNTSAWQGENGEMFQQQQKKHPSASRSCCCERSWPWMLEGCFSVMIIDACWWYLWHPQCILKHILGGVKQSLSTINIWLYTPKPRAITFEKKHVWNSNLDQISILSKFLMASGKTQVYRGSFSNRRHPHATLLKTWQKTWPSMAPASPKSSRDALPKSLHHWIGPQDLEPSHWWWWWCLVWRMLHIHFGILLCKYHETPTVHFTFLYRISKESRETVGTRSGCWAPCPRNSEMALAWVESQLSPRWHCNWSTFRPSDHGSICNGCRGHLPTVPSLEFQLLIGLDFDISFCSTRNSQGKVWAVHCWLSDLVAFSKQSQWKSGIRCPPLH